ncbi:hypothetical protein FORC60_3735 [Bacillus cereus]|nr:hypothetical protein FORC60_3735 [Bacillus cereus]
MPALPKFQNLVIGIAESLQSVFPSFKLVVGGVGCSIISTVFSFAYLREASAMSFAALDSSNA